MPLLLTPPEPLLTTSLLPTPQLYAIIEDVKYPTRAKVISFEVLYYPSEAARIADAAPLQLPGLPTRFHQAATPDQANAVPIFDFLDQVLQAQLTPLLPAGTTIERVA